MAFAAGSSFAEDASFDVQKKEILYKFEIQEIIDKSIENQLSNPNQLESILNVLKSFGLLDTMDPLAIKDIIVALPHDHLNELELALNILKSFGLLDRMGTWTIKDIILALPHDHLNELELALNILKSFGLLDIMEPRAIKYIIVELPHGHPNQLEWILNVLKSFGLQDKMYLKLFEYNHDFVKKLGVGACFNLAWPLIEVVDNIHFFIVWRNSMHVL
jgi:hypothetical protein